MYLDIHSHILPNIDDGAEDLSISQRLLEIIHSQNITDIIATPHFYPMFDNLEEFIENRQNSINLLLSSVKDTTMPNIYLGCEVLYYSGISYASGLEKLTLANSRYILLEPDYCLLNAKLQREILHLRDLGFIPIITHIERYQKAKGFRSFYKFVKEKRILVQVNATSFFSKHYNRILKKLVKDNIISFIASDTHSVDVRPPMIKPALDKITAAYGDEYANRLIKNSQKLLNEITKRENEI